ncbi:MAG: hypothetical protein WEA09_00400 [Gemmatimonadota bacterium]
MKVSGLLPPGGWFWAVLPLLVAGALGEGVSAQVVGGGEEGHALLQSCTLDDESRQAPCVAAIREARAIQAALGILTLGGSPVPGSPGTVGRRLASSPRVSISTRTQLLRVPLPTPETDVDGLQGDGSAFMLGGDATVAVGVFDGFFLAPTVGGILSVDALAGAHFLGLPGGAGFSRWRMGYSAGARLGIVRESFTLPGLAITARYAEVGPAVRGSLEGSERERARVDLRATSLRATVGKELRALGFLAGAGWDRYRSDPVVGLPGDSGGGLTGQRDTRDRTVYFAGVSMTHLVLQLSGEVGWSPGREDGLPFPTTGFDPARAGIFGSLGFRLTF